MKIYVVSVPTHYVVSPSFFSSSLPLPISFCLYLSLSLPLQWVCKYNCLENNFQMTLHEDLSKLRLWVLALECVPSYITFCIHHRVLYSISNKASSRTTLSLPQSLVLKLSLYLKRVSLILLMASCQHHCIFSACKTLLITDRLNH